MWEMRKIVSVGRYESGKEFTKTLKISRFDSIITIILTEMKVMLDLSAERKMISKEPNIFLIKALHGCV